MCFGPLTGCQPQGSQISYIEAESYSTNVTTNKVGLQWPFMT